MKPSGFLLAALLVTTGCASTNFTEYRGPDLREGSGGTVRTVDGIEFWENGNPNRKFKILGVIEDRRGDGLFSGSADKSLANLAKAKGGTAVILMQRTKQPAGIDEYGNIRLRVSNKVMVVKYVD
jgi:catalase (peroxidase I)